MNNCNQCVVYHWSLSFFHGKIYFLPSVKWLVITHWAPCVASPAPHCPSRGKKWWVMRSKLSPAGCPFACPAPAAVTAPCLGRCLSGWIPSKWASTARALPAPGSPPWSRCSPWGMSKFSHTHMAQVQSCHTALIYAVSFCTVTERSKAAVNLNMCRPLCGRTDIPLGLCIISGFFSSRFWLIQHLRK